MKPRTHKTTARSHVIHWIGTGLAAAPICTCTRHIPTGFALSLRSGHRRGPRGLGGSWRSRIMAQRLGLGGGMARTEAVRWGVEAHCRGRADLRVRRPRDPHPRSFHPRRRPEASGRNGGTFVAGRTTRLKAMAASLSPPWGFRSTCLPSSRASPERSWDGGTWPIFWRAPAR